MIDKGQNVLLFVFIFLPSAIIFTHILRKWSNYAENDA